MSPAPSNSGLRVAVRLAERGLDVELTVGAGEVLAVLGPNGAGKSTLLDIVAGLLPPDGGEVRLAGRVLTDVAKGIAVPPHRRGVSLLAQDPLLFPHLSVAANVAFGPRSRGLGGRAAAETAQEWLRAVDATELAARRPGGLSGGQAQRVALARALAVQPRLILLDEPMAALDVTVAPAMRALLHRVLREPARNAHAPSAVLVTHDIVDALTLADRVVVLEAGRIVEQGPVGEVLSRPRSTFAAHIAGVNLLMGTAIEPVPGGQRTSGDDESADASAELAPPDRDRSIESATRSADAVESATRSADSAGPGTRAVGGVGAGTWSADAAGSGTWSAGTSESGPRSADAVGSGTSRAGAAGLGTWSGGAVRSGDEVVYGRCDGPWVAGDRAAAVFSPAAVAVYRERPSGSPRNVFRVRVADLTPAAVGELGLRPGQVVYFAVKATEVQVYSC